MNAAQIREPASQIYLEIEGESFFPVITKEVNRPNELSVSEALRLSFVYPDILYRL